MSAEQAGPRAKALHDGSMTALPLPSNIEAERCALDGMLLGTPESNDAIDRARIRLYPRHFHDARHRPIYGAMLILRDRGQCVTLVTLIEELNEPRLIG